MDGFFQQLPAIIEKSAASPLSLLALIIIASSIIAFLFFKDASEKVRMRTFALLFSGVLILGFQVLSSVTTSETATSDLPAASGALAPGFGSEPAPVAPAPVAGVDRAAAAGAPDPVPPAPSPAAPVVPAEPVSSAMPAVDHDLSGTWFALDGSWYDFEQRGARVSFEEWNPVLGATAEGTGELVGARLEVFYSTALGTTGAGALQVSPDGTTLTGSVTDHVTGARMPITLFRED